MRERTGKRDRRWALGVGVRVALAALALALQLPQVDDLIIRAIYPDAWLPTQAVMGGMVHYVQAVAFGASITLAAEAALSLFAHCAKALATRRARLRLRRGRPIAGRRAEFYDDDGGGEMKDAA